MHVCCARCSDAYNLGWVSVMDNCVHFVVSWLYPWLEFHGITVLTQWGHLFQMCHCCLVYACILAPLLSLVGVLCNTWTCEICLRWERKLPKTMASLSPSGVRTVDWKPIGILYNLPRWNAHQVCIAGFHGFQVVFPPGKKVFLTFAVRFLVGLPKNGS